MADTPTPDRPKRRRTAKAAGSTKAPTRKPRKTAAAATPAAETKAATATPAAKPVGARKAPATKRASAPKPRRAPRKAVEPAKQPTASASRPAAVPRKAAETSEGPPRAGLFAALGTLAAVGGAFFVWRATRADEPSYQTVESDGPIEIRKYPAMVTAGTEVRGARQAALVEGFRTLADYIFAKSRSGPKIAMTAPVLADTQGSGSWRTRFVMPADKARAALPVAPPGVELVSEPARRIAAMRFSGRADDATLDSKEGALRSWLQIRGLPSEGKALHAFYNAPFTPGPFRRNEVMVVLSEEGGMG